MKITAIVKQLPVNHSRCFRSIREEKDAFIDVGDYVSVYADELEIEELNEKKEKQICEDLFTLLNVGRPKHFAGRSMSVSDIVALVDNNKGTIKYYYCNAFGFIEVKGC